MDRRHVLLALVVLVGGVDWLMKCVAETIGAVDKFQHVGTGHCGDTYLTHPIFSSIICAAICSRDSGCEGFVSSKLVPPLEECHLTKNIASTDQHPSYNCFQRVVPPTPTTTTTTAAPTTTGPWMTVSMIGTGGIQTVGFTKSTAIDSFMNNLYSKSFISTDMPPPPTVKSGMTADGEECVAGQVMVGFGELNTGDSDKDDQRMYCADIVSPLSLTSDCTNVTLGQEPRPVLTHTNTSEWFNWLSCPQTHLLTRLYWTYDAAASVTSYRYTAAGCCKVTS